MDMMTPHHSPSSIPGLLQHRATTHGNDTILRGKQRGLWQPVTWAQLADRVRQIGTALLAADVTRGDVAAILSGPRPEAVYADLAILGSGAASVAIDPDDDAVRVSHLLSSSGSRLAFVEDEQQLDKILSIRDRCPALSRIVLFDTKGLRDFADATCISLSAFAETAGAADWTAAIHAIEANQPAVIQFPRCQEFAMGRTLTHDDLLHMVATARQRQALKPGDERLAVLPMADITERVWALYLALDTRCISNYPERLDTALENLRELQPTVLGADAAVWDHLCALATTRSKAATSLQRRTYEWALRAGRLGGPGARLADLLVLRAVRREFGLNRLRLAYIGGASPSLATLDWARSLGIPIHRLDQPPGGTGEPDPRYQALMQSAYA